MIDMNKEKIVPMGEAAEAFPSPPSRETLWRYRAIGIRGVKLETLVFAGRRYTSREAIKRFIEASTKAIDATTRRSVLAASA